MPRRDQSSEPPARSGYLPLLEESADDLYEHAPCGYFSTLPDGTIVKVNETLLSWTGYEREDLVGQRRVHDLLAPGDRIYYETNYAPLLHMQGEVREVAVELECADGRRLPALVNSVLRRDEAGAPLLVRTTVFDATDRREFERELVRAREEADARARAALALAHVNDGVLLVDADGRVELLNAAAELLLRVESAAVAGEPVSDAIPGWKSIAPRIPVGERDRWPSPVTLPLPRERGEQWITVAGVDSGEGIVYTIRDVTAGHRLEELRNQLVTILSHELRTPLAGVYGAAQTLLEHWETLDEGATRQLLAMIAEQGERLRLIVDEIHLTSRLDADEIELEDAVFDAAALVERVVAEFRRKAGDGAALSAEAGEELRARGDAAYTEQVLVYLVDNAVKYSPAGAAVRVSAQAAEGRARLVVADEGPGIPPGERERIFEKFYRLDPEQRAGVGGVGLGLYVARELVARMGGRIGLLPSERGCSFFVDLPAADPRPLA